MKTFIVKLFQCLFCWKIAVSHDEDIRRAEVVVGQSFGLRENSPGESNEALAKIAKELHERFGLPLVLQWEIADCLDVSSAGVIREHRIQGRYLDAYEVLSQAKGLCEEEDWKRAIILAHPDHYWRCMMIAKKLGFEVVTVDTSSVPYDELSAQSWTRSAIRFIPREIASRLLFLFMGRI